MTSLFQLNLIMATLPPQFCTLEEWAISAGANPPLHCHTHNESIALAVGASYLTYIVHLNTAAVCCRGGCLVAVRMLDSLCSDFREYKHDLY